MRNCNKLTCMLPNMTDKSSALGLTVCDWTICPYLACTFTELRGESTSLGSKKSVNVAEINIELKYSMFYVRFCLRLLLNNIYS